MNIDTIKINPKSTNEQGGEQENMSTFNTQLTFLATQF